MINLDEVGLLTAEDFVRRTQENNAAIRDLLNDNEMLVQAFVNDKNMTQKEVADYLRCDHKAIPASIPRIPVTRGKYLYKKSDIEAWLRSHKKTKDELL